MAAQENHSELVKYLLANNASQTLATEVALSLSLSLYLSISVTLIISSRHLPPRASGVTTNPSRAKAAKHDHTPPEAPSQGSNFIRKSRSNRIECQRVVVLC